jgi:protein-export membrane protein SecD
MRNRNTLVLGLIILLALVALWIDLPVDHPRWAQQMLFWQPAEYRDLEIKQGLDLRGGTQILLEAKPAEGRTVTAQDMQSAMTIVERRVNALGVSEPLVQLQGENRIIVELPGIDNPDQALQTLKGTGQLEFVEIPSGTNVSQGDFIRTTSNDAVPAPESLGTIPNPYPEQVFQTILTGAQLQDASTQLDQYGAPMIAFELKGDGPQIFANYTGANIGGTLAIVLDNVILSAPTINSQIPDGAGHHRGSFHPGGGG